MADKAPVDMTDDELLERVRGARNATYYVNDWLAELDRRRQERQAEESTRLSRIAIGAAIASAIAAAVSAVAALVAIGTASAS
jgi:hypothetical protein